MLLVDTAGLDPDADRGLPAAIQAQAESAVADADAIMFVVDGKAGLLPEDEVDRADAAANAKSRWRSRSTRSTSPNTMRIV